MMRSDRRSSVWNSCTVKHFGLYSPLAPRLFSATALCACCAASSVTRPAPAAHDFAAHGLDDGGERIVHVAHLLDFVFAPAEMEAQHGNPPLVHGRGVDLAI